MHTPWLMRCLLIFGFLLGSAACGAPTVARDAAALKLDLVFPAADLRAFAAADTAAELAKLQPKSLLVLICDNVKLEGQVKNFCSESQKDFNHRVLFTDFSAGAGTIGDVPPKKDQVIVVEGRAADNSVTYQGFATLPTIEPRVTYDVNIQMAQVIFPNLPKPDAPIILSPAPSPVTLAPDATEIIITGTRVANTRLRISATPAELLGTVREFSRDELPMYDETINADGTINWTVKIEQLLSDGSAVRAYTFYIDVSRSGEEKFSDKKTLTVTHCSVLAPTCGI